MRRSSWITGLLAVLVTAGVFATDVLVPPVETEPTPVASQRATIPAAGGATCAIGDGRGGADLQLITAAPGSLLQQPAQVTVTGFAEGERTGSDVRPIFPRAAVATDPEPGELGGVDVRWRDAPVAVSRTWTLSDHDDLPDVTVAGPCPSTPGDLWIVPGLSTEGGNEARVRLANPFDTAATVAVRFLTPSGPEEPLILRNLSVPGNSVRELLVNETLPEQADLSALVEVASGRLVVEGAQFARAAIGDVDGGSLLTAASSTAEQWTVPWIRDDAATRSWLWVANPGQRTAAVELTLHTEDGGTVPTGLAEVSVAPEDLQRVDLTGVLPDGVEVVAITARSNGAPIAVSAGTIFRADAPAATGQAVSLGAPATDREWVVSGTGAADRDERLRLVNPTGDVAVVDVEVFDGSSTASPEALQGVDVPAGAAIELELGPAIQEAALWSAFVRARSGEVVVGRVGTHAAPRAQPTAPEDGEADGGGNAAEDGADTQDEPGSEAGDGGAQPPPPQRLIAHLATPSAAWRTTTTGLVPQHRERLVNQLRTRPGIAPGAEPAPDVVEPELGGR